MSVFSAGPRPPSARIAGWIPRDLAQLVVERAELGRHRGLCRAQLERERDELLLSPIVRIALDPPPHGVGGGDDPRSRGGEIRMALGIGDRRRHEVREAGETCLGVAGKGLPRAGDRDHDAPEAPADDDRGPDR
jgi:hypothetical protein